jgi:hypothetical protein
MRPVLRASARRRLLFALVAALVVLHVFPPRGGPEPLVFGVLPFDLAVALAWMIAAGLVVVWMTTPALWPDAPPERDP